MRVSINKKLTDELAKAFQDICRVKTDKIKFVTKGTILEEHEIIFDERNWE